MRHRPKFFREGYYILKGKLAVPCRDLMTWARWFETANRFVAKTQIGGVQVSTVFLGLDHSFAFLRPNEEVLPLLFETMVFRGGKGDECERYGTWQEAEAGHKRWVAVVRAEIKEKVND